MLPGHSAHILSIIPFVIFKTCPKYWLFIYLFMIVNFEPNTNTERIKLAEQQKGISVVYTTKSLYAICNSGLFLTNFLTMLVINLDYQYLYCGLPICVYVYSIKSIYFLLFSCLINHFYNQAKFISALFNKQLIFFINLSIHLSMKSSMWDQENQSLNTEKEDMSCLETEQG